MSVRLTNQNRFSGPGGFSARGLNQWLNRSMINSIQRGTVTLTAVTSNFATITAVVTANSILSWIGLNYNTDLNAAASAALVVIDLTDSVTVTGTKLSGTNVSVVGFEVLEYVPGILKSIKRGTITLDGVASNTDTITAVDTTKSQLVMLGWVSDQANGYWARLSPRIALTNSTTVTATKSIATDKVIVGYEVREYY